MKRFLLIICLCFGSLFLFAHGSILTDHSKIKEYSSFKIIGVIDLRVGKDYSSEVKYRTLNHEGGMCVTVLEVLKEDVKDNKHGKWFYVLLTSPMWVEGETWIE